MTWALPPEKPAKSPAHFTRVLRNNSWIFLSFSLGFCHACCCGVLMSVPCPGFALCSSLSQEVNRPVSKSQTLSGSYLCYSVLSKAACQRGCCYSTAVTKSIGLSRACFWDVHPLCCVADASALRWCHGSLCQDQDVVGEVVANLAPWWLLVSYVWLFLLLSILNVEVWDCLEQSLSLSRQGFGFQSNTC